jgi:hypothetical protein
MPSSRGRRAAIRKGDPTEGALVVAATKAGLGTEETLALRLA